MAALRPARLLLLLTTLALGVSLAVPLGAAMADSPAAGTETPSVITHVTLITGDVVDVTTSVGGQTSAAMRPGPNGSVPPAAITQVNDHLYVVPFAAVGLLATHSLDRRLFDVTELIADEYDDQSRATLPVLIDYGTGQLAAARSRVTTYSAARQSLSVPELGMAAYSTNKAHARQFWADLTKGSDDAGNPTALTQGAQHVYLDGRVQAALEDSVPQIHAPEAWAEGYDGAGSTVAVLDTGYDPKHPDLQNVVTKTQNFTTASSVVDGNGHGTHVASTIAGSGAASAGLRTGVAPGADLFVGKVLGDDGYGEDSWVLAGMVWAVDQGADVVSMSLGGDTSDGSDPMSQAIDQLSASSDSLFVVAAGNNGDFGPSTVTAPGAADAALTVGAVDLNNTMASFSGRGPRAGNGALKPEVVAPGVDVTAARAAGTEIGPIVDQYYTTLSGTSMATPHVAGEAAIVKERHPNWSGERIKDVLANSTVPISNATAFDAGTGRIDVLKAIHEHVIAPATVSLGSYRWPYSTIQPTTTKVRYTNTTASAVTLDLALTSEDGSAEPTGAMTLTKNQITVPAHGKAPVKIVLDPAHTDPGSYSAVVTATPNDGSETVRTGLSFLLEPERYDVTITIKPRDGSQYASHMLGFAGKQDPWIYEQRTFDASPNAQTATFRVPPGDYSTGVISSGLATDGATQGLISYQPQIHVTKDISVVLDENDTSQFDYQVDQPAVADGAILDVEWNGDEGPASYMFSGSQDQVYAQPSAGIAGGQTSIAANWILAEPDGLLSRGSSAAIGLRPIAAPGGSVTSTPIRVVDDQYRIVDAGSAVNPDTSHVGGALAFISGTCADLTDAVSALKHAGAAAVVAYAGSGQLCAGTIDRQFHIPTMQARPFDAATLLGTSGGSGHLTTHASPSYMYNLLHFWPNEVPSGGTVDGTGNHVATLTEHYRGLDSDSADGISALEELIGWVPARNGVANFGFERMVPFPGTVTHYVSTGAEWERTVMMLDSTYGGEYARLWDPRQTFTGGQTYHDTWFGGPIGNRVSQQFNDPWTDPLPVRLGNDIYLQYGAFTDAQGHMANTDIFSPEFTGKIYQDGELWNQLPSSVFMSATVKPGKHDFRAVFNTKRENPFWQLSNHMRTEWTFSSRTAHGAPKILPILGINYRMKLSNRNLAHAGDYTFKIKFEMPNGVTTLPVTHRRIDISWNGGDRWDRLAPEHCSDTSCTFEVNNRQGRTASFTVKAADSAGHTVKQKLINAYRVKSR